MHSKTNLDELSFKTPQVDKLSVENLSVEKQWLEKVNHLLSSESAQKTLASKTLTSNIRHSKIRIMNVCGGHERSISMAGLRKALHPKIELIPGPGCPVCVCPEEDIYQAIQLALNEDIILLAFGDMLRVPINVAKNEIRTLQQAKASGADIRPIASPLEARKIALDNANKKVVFFAAGFETTTAPVAALIAEGLPDNLLFLLSARLTWPAISLLLNSADATEGLGFDALIAPGHVATIMGTDEWQFVVKKHHIATAVAGFTTESLLSAFYSVIRQTLEEHLFLDNCYPQVVKQNGNLTAQKHLSKTMDIIDTNWRGIGIIPNSGFELKDAYKNHNARLVFPSYQQNARKHIGEMPAGCDCAHVVLGKKYPHQCKLYAKTCTPKHPIGPCMVSDEGACRIWWTYH